MKASKTYLGIVGLTLCIMTQICVAVLNFFLGGLPVVGPLLDIAQLALAITFVIIIGRITWAFLKPKGDAP